MATVPMDHPDREELLQAQAELEQFSRFMQGKNEQAPSQSSTPLTATPPPSIAPAPSQEEMEVDKDKRLANQQQGPDQPPAKWAKGEAKGDKNDSTGPPRPTGKGTSDEPLLRAAAAFAGTGTTPSPPSPSQADSSKAPPTTDKKEDKQETEALAQLAGNSPGRAGLEEHQELVVQVADRHGVLQPEGQSRQASNHLSKVLHLLFAIPISSAPVVLAFSAAAVLRAAVAPTIGAIPAFAAPVAPALVAFCQLAPPASRNRCAICCFTAFGQAFWPSFGEWRTPRKRSSSTR